MSEARFTYQSYTLKQVFKYSYGHAFLFVSIESLNT